MGSVPARSETCHLQGTVCGSSGDTTDAFWLLEEDFTSAAARKGTLQSYSLFLLSQEAGTRTGFGSLVFILIYYQFAAQNFSFRHRNNIKIPTERSLPSSKAFTAYNMTEEVR